MVNAFQIKRIMGLGVAAFVPFALCLFVLVLTQNLLIAAFMGMVAVPLMVFLGSAFLMTPFRSMLEGAGILVFDITSSGIIKPYIAYPKMPNLDINVDGNFFRSVYNRSIGMYLKGGAIARMDDTGETIKFELPKDDYSKSYFALADKPILFWNSKLNTFLTKEVLAEKENKLMIENTALQTLDQARGMRKDLHELTRTVVDQFKPNGLGELLKNPWFIVIVVAITLFLIFMFVAPQLPKFFGYIETGASAITPGIPVSPLLANLGWF